MFTTQLACAEEPTVTDTGVTEAVTLLTVTLPPPLLVPPPLPQPARLRAKRAMRTAGGGRDIIQFHGFFSRPASVYLDGCIRIFILRIFMGGAELRGLTAVDLVLLG
jgi:hypothetical protein